MAQLLLALMLRDRPMKLWYVDWSILISTACSGAGGRAGMAWLNEPAHSLDLYFSVLAQRLKRLCVELDDRPYDSTNQSLDR